jgi:hypothetical protein
MKKKVADSGMDVRRYFTAKPVQRKKSKSKEKEVPKSSVESLSEIAEDKPSFLKHAVKKNIPSEKEREKIIEKQKPKKSKISVKRGKKEQLEKKSKEEEEKKTPVKRKKKAAEKTKEKKKGSTGKALEKLLKPGSKSLKRAQKRTISEVYSKYLKHS